MVGLAEGASGASRKNALRGWLRPIVFGTVAGSLFAFGWAVGAFDAAPMVEPGDAVAFHVTAYRQDGAVLFTTNPEMAGRELGTGNPWINPDLTNDTYQPIVGRARPAPQTTEVSARAAFEPWGFLLGHRPGDVVRTPYIVEPLGSRRNFSVPAAIGPLETVFVLNLTQLYDDENATKTRARWGDRDGLRPGAVVPYAGVWQASVVGVEGDSVTLRAGARPGEPVRSRTLGINLTAQELQEGWVLLRPELAVGDVFVTQGCELPVDRLVPGRFRVVAELPDRFIVQRAPPYFEHVLGENLRLELEILELDKGWSWRSALNAVLDMGR